MSDTVRRVVTGHEGDGRAIVTIDEVMAANERDEARVRFFKLWTTDRTPADNNDDRDGALRGSGLTSEGGSVLRIVDFAPGLRSPMHRTLSVDYGIVLQGEIDLELDDGKVTYLKAGDVVVQRGTIHAWVNNSDAWCRMAFVLVAAEPVRIASAELPPVSG